jgi:hypothetical protein
MVQSAGAPGKARMLKGIDEFNASPVVFRRNKFELSME